MEQSRRTFTRDMLGSLLVFSLMESLSAGGLFGKSIKPIAAKWLVDLDHLSQDLRGKKLKQPDWHQKIAELFARVDLEDVLRTIDYDRLAQGIKLPADREAARAIDLPKIEGIPEDLSFVTLFFALRKDAAIVPHAHQNLATMHLILDGTVRLQQFDRVHSDAEFLIIKPTIDKTATRRDLSLITDEKDNVHWFKGISERTFTFNIGIYGVDPKEKTVYREYLDPLGGEKLSDGSVRAKRIKQDQAYRLYGRV